MILTSVQLNLSRSQEQGLILAEMCPAQWVTLHNNIGLPAYFRTHRPLLVHAIPRPALLHSYGNKGGV